MYSEIFSDSNKVFYVINQIRRRYKQEKRVFFPQKFQFDFPHDYAWFIVPIPGGVMDS